MTARDETISIISDAAGYVWDEGLTFNEALTKAFWQWRKAQIEQDTYNTALGLDVVNGLQNAAPDWVLGPKPDTV